MNLKFLPPWPTPNERSRLVSVQEICRQAGISTSSWHRLKGRPQPVSIGARGKRWWSLEIDQFLASLPRVASMAAETSPASMLSARPEPQPQHPLLGHNHGPPLDEPAPTRKRRPAKRRRRRSSREPPAAAPAEPAAE
jgi:predicted DNA-binding transcriptional regulator AlpA